MPVMLSIVLETYDNKKMVYERNCVKFTDKTSVLDAFEFRNNRTHLSHNDRLFQSNG